MYRFAVRIALILAVGFCSSPISWAAVLSSTSLPNLPSSAATGTNGLPVASVPGPVHITDQGQDTSAAAGKLPSAEATSNPTFVPANAPNQFQKFVQLATGKLLPVFGANFFSRSNTVAPIQAGPVPSDYPLGPGDEVLIRAWGSIDINYRTTIDRNGLISIPRIGTLSLAGVKAGNVEEVIRNAISKNYRNFHLNVTLGRLRAITVYVVGQARHPGSYTVSSLSTLVTALFQSGGPNANGSLRRVEVKRGDKQVAEMDLYAFLARGDTSNDVRLLDGDVIVIPPKGPQVALTGEVETPGIYELRGDHDDLQSLLAVAGGLPVLANPHQALLERIDPTQTRPRTVEQFALDAAGLAKTLKDGDLLTVLPITPAFANAITLRGSMFHSLRLPYRPGMRVTDLIPSKAYLVSQAAVGKQNGALLSKNLLGSVGNLYTDINWDYAVVERIKRKDSEPALIPFDLGRALADPSGADNISLLPGDTVTVFSSADLQIPINQRHVYVSLEGEVRHPGVYQVSAGETLSKVVSAAGGLTPQAYLYGAEFDRVSVRKLQQKNMDRLLNKLQQQSLSQESTQAANQSVYGSAGGQLQTQLAAEQAARAQFFQRLREIKPTGRITLGLAPDATDASMLPSLHLENGDRLMVPSRPDFVQVYGAVDTESSLLWQPGKSVSDYVARAGVARDGDTDALFVLHADGTVASNSGHWLSGVGGANIYPGDIIVVPEKFDRTSFWTAFMQNAKDFTQVFANFGLGAAGIKALGY